MQEITRIAIESLLAADASVGSADKRLILATCTSKQPPRRLGTVKEAAEILNCNPRTIQRYSRQGRIRAIHFSKRHVRYDLNEVERFAVTGTDED